MTENPQTAKVLAFVGMAGSGKSEASHYAQKITGLPVVYFGQLTRDEVARRGLELTPSNEKKVREELRATEGMDVYAKRALPTINKYIENNQTVFIDGLYSLAEWQFLVREFPNLAVIAITAAPETRYARLAYRSDRPFSREEAQARDIDELRKLEKAGPIAMANYTIVNEGTQQELEAKVREVLDKEGVSYDSN